VASRRRWASGGRELHKISTRNRDYEPTLHLLHGCAVMRCFWSGKVTYIWDGTHHTRLGFTGSGGTRKKYDSATTTRQRRLLGDERSGPEGARTHNVTIGHRKRNGTTAAARPIHDQSSPATTRADPPTPVPTTATPPRTRLGYRAIDAATVSATTLGIYYLPCGPVIIVRESPPMSATERCRPCGCYRVRSKNIVQRARRNSRAVMPGKNKYQPYNI